MDEVAGLLVEQIAKRLRESRRAARPQVQVSPVVRAIPRRAGFAPANRTAAPPATRTAEAPIPATPSRPERPAPAPDPFALPAPNTATPLNPLLAAFASRSGLLGAIVLGEALAPPLALRERKGGHS